MWVEEIILNNIKCFGEKYIKLGTYNEAPYPWITFLGENGTGKSTVLQAIALMLAGPEGASQLLRPIGWLKNNAKPGRIDIAIHPGKNDPGVYPGKITQKKGEANGIDYSFYITGTSRIEILDRVFNDPEIYADDKDTNIRWLRENVFSSNSKGWFGAGYGAFRRLSRKNKFVSPSRLSTWRFDNFSSQFNEDEPLEAFENWMVYLDYRISKAHDELAKKQMAWGIDAINQLLPEGNTFDSIDADGKIWFNTGNSKTSLSALSDGFRSVMALAGDLICRLIEAFPNSHDPLKEQGVVLVDELDIHLHPTWQRKIAGLLRQTFPGIQFIMATHSPLVAAGAGEDAVTYRFYKKDGDVEVEQIKNIHAMSVDKLLQSPAFGLVSAFSPETQDKIDKYYSLKKKKKLNKAETEELENTLPIIETSLGYESIQSETEKELNDFIKKNWK